MRPSDPDVYKRQHDAWSAPAEGGPVMPLARLLLVLATLLLAGLDRRTQAEPARQEADDAQQLVQGELRLVEMTGALDAQRQMNALISHEPVSYTHLDVYKRQG